jgi:hypothetical protein
LHRGIGNDSGVLWNVFINSNSLSAGPWKNRKVPFEAILMNVFLNTLTPFFTFPIFKVPVTPSLMVDFPASR